MHLEGERDHVGEDDVAAPGHGVQVAGSLGAQLLLSEVATAVAGRLLGINPFDQPNVQAAKTATDRTTTSIAPPARPPTKPTLYT